ncbi:MAG TPA: helix-turn-helix domain-containing protein [Dongiaceae bacterium]|nr:helix-turn-helix domain-containing protein [Dongiaceae bacterium]
MQRTDFAEMFCPAARALACVGEWWSLLILRDVFQGLRRFDEIKDSLGISTNILARRLQHLTGNGILARRLYQQRPARYEYVLTEKGRELFPLLLLLYRWGNQYETPEGIAVELANRATGRALDPVVVDRRSGEAVTLEQVMLRTGPAASPAAIARVELMATRRATASDKAVPGITPIKTKNTRMPQRAGTAGSKTRQRKRASS